MNAIRWLGMATVVIAAGLLAGCEDGKAPPAASAEKPKDNAEAQSSLAGLSQEDRQAAEAQKVCPVTGEELGEMGVPFKVTLSDQPVFLCCKSCKKKALADPDKTLAKVKELKAQNASKKD